MVAKAEAREEKLGIIATSAPSQSDRWQDVLRCEGEDDDPEDQSCNICSL